MNKNVSHFLLNRNKTKSYNYNISKQSEGPNKMEQEFFDCVILGTGIQQCILAEIISSKGYKVIQIDQHETYGGDLRTLRYSDLILKMNQHNKDSIYKSSDYKNANSLKSETNKNSQFPNQTGEEKSSQMLYQDAKAENTQKRVGKEELLRLDRKFNVDLVPKFLLADGLMKDLLIEHDLQNLVEFVDIQGSYVFKEGVLHAVPCNEKESFTSGLISLMQKPRVAKFFWSVRKFCELKQSLVNKICFKCGDGFLCSGKCNISEKKIPCAKQSTIDSFDNQNGNNSSIASDSVNFTAEQFEDTVEKEEYFKLAESQKNFQNLNSEKAESPSEIVYSGHEEIKVESNLKNEINCNNEEKILQENNEIQPDKLTYDNRKMKMDLAGRFKFNHINMLKEFESYSLSTKSIEIIGHAIALNLDNDYLKQHPIHTYDKLFFYIKSVIALNNLKTPFIYPLFGLSEICQAFTRRAGGFGCVFMLNTPVLRIANKNGVIYEENQHINDYAKEFNLSELDLKINFGNNKVDSIIDSFVDEIQGKQQNNDEKIDASHNSKNAFNMKCVEKELENIQHPNFAYKYEIIIKDNINNKLKKLLTNKIISESKYFKNNTRPINQIITCICIVKGNIKLIDKKYNGISSAHVIFLSSDMKRKNDIFLATLGERENACPLGYTIGIISTIRETEDKPENEVKDIIDLLGNVVDVFCWVRETRKKKLDDDGIVIASDVDQTTHFESLYDDIQRCINEIGQLSKKKIWF
ncbi:hypothetical protein EDEG_00010 [Edhazardia aedis USNM 41457]|uniref:Rab GDP dissociation inhibitor n=1 Tax=Edhazardia aedis (strain USNM 41457) TaxID=1003232 RepID=J9DKM8_EDHAE|nr:hypothetical protein EDEG_00010 [Edhazardia aedis USNM 41457]|eukprot:EJW03140.1 hypothetical protein EDEG_00010 [Edhazardia aedis USNM 41457]